MWPMREQTRERASRLGDALIDLYVEWREECLSVHSAYERWRSAPRDDSPAAFAAYNAALDREERAGAKFADADLMGHPWQIIVGPRGAAAGKVELKRRATGERTEVTPDEALARIA